ncbi:predicted protein [Streptomyces viridosporus ATCC 14672]|uniref:Predicted protein n=1 Tax=Streptomyces viridosporus (strain ATCC 14672 / DSM 40746 / JCM 4963 / KCTC 9882 / NRRL B-12104 / FH 1290) TaxID=566461 RepID=D6AAP2_STRV1|nr:predicted protein [Streptomyces viridosporus ATCC 14672]
MSKTSTLFLTALDRNWTEGSRALDIRVSEEPEIGTGAHVSEQSAVCQGRVEP